MEKPRINYTKSLLNETIKRDRAILIGEYNDIISYTEINFICKCGKENMKIFRNAYLKSKFLCKECSEKERREKIENTNIEKFGFKSPLQNLDFKEKMKEVFIEKFGVDNVSKLQSIKDKKKETTFNHFGVEYPGQSLEVKDKIKQTNLKKYGVECTLKIEEVKEKIKQTTLKKFGVEHN